MNEAIMHLALIDEETIQIDRAALELAALDHPGTDPAPRIALLDAIAERLAALGGDAPGNARRARLLARVIAGEFGFSGDAETYDDPANADLLRVIDRRRGLPVSLAILYVAAARRLNWAADVLNVPGHVVVRVGAEIGPVLIDPFRDGCEIGHDALAAIVSGMAGEDTPLSAEHLAPLSNRAILTRLLLNQATRAEQAGDTARAATLYERMTIVAPASAQAWWQSARLQLTGGDVAAARASLTALLEMTREPELRGRVARTLARLAQD